MEREMNVRPPRILMVDDESTNLQVVRLILSRENLAQELIMFNSGRAALDYLAQNPVDLILLDLAMPEMNGFEVFGELRASPVTRDIPVIFLSAYHDTEYILNAFQLGASDFIGKPIISPVLTARIAALLQTQALKRELQHQNEALERANRLKDELMSIASHDLRSPLSAIDLLCQFMTESLAGKKEHQPPELVARILHQSRLARRLVENLLNLNRIEEGILTPVRSFFSLESLVAECVEDERPIMEGRGLSVSLAPLPEDLVCYGDRNLIAQVVRNVLGNAVKFAAARIEITWERPASTPEMGAESLGLKILDDGPGIPPEQIQRLFKKYAKGEQRESGTGLGLFIAKQVMRLHGGDISAHSQSGALTCFDILLPNVFAQDSLPELSAVFNRRVRVISPTKTSGSVFAGVMEEAGLLDVMVVAPEPKVLQHLAEESPHLLFLDLDGDPEAARNLAEWLVQLPIRCPFLIYGPFEAIQTFHEVWESPCLSLSPPLNPQHLLLRVEELLSDTKNMGSSAAG
ncbi:MAG: hybrid sensor histidine kinase/response regulator [Deltaproteobacteria bacterium]|nr:hybrid sensor histidine kinase/response regulator [Deltaproteobacteria bacterium]